MNKRPEKKRASLLRLRRSIDACLWITLGLWQLLFIGCDRPQENIDDLGTEVMDWQIEQAQQAALSGLDPEKIQVGDIVYFVETQEVSTSDGPVTNLVSEHTIEVIDSRDEGERHLLTTLKTMVDHEKEERPIYKFENELAFQKISQEAGRSVAQNRLSLKIMERDAPTNKSLAPVITDVTYHNLQVKREFSPPPVAVTKTEDCGGIFNCQLEVTSITYEIVFHFSDSTRQRHGMQWRISTEVPVFASILEQCATTLVPIENSRVLVKQCESLRDFKTVAP